MGNPEFFPPVPGSLEGILLAESLLVLLTSTDSQTLVSSLLCIFSPSHISTAHLLLISPENRHSQKDIIPPIFIECLLIARHWIGTEDIHGSQEAQYTGKTDKEPINNSISDQNLF